MNYEEAINQNVDIESEQATPEEQAQYEKAVDIAMRMLHGAIAKQINKIILNAKDLADGLASGLFVLVRRTEQELGAKMPESVRLQVGEDLLEELLSILVETDRISEGEVTDQLIEKVVEKAVYRFMEDEQNQGGLNEKAIAEDIAAVGGEAPQGMNAMSNEEVQTRGLLQ